MEIDEVKMDTSPKCEETPISADLINVSEGFHLRTCYKRKVKTSKLDGLLERRVKQFTLEEKQRLERIKAASSSSDCKSLSPQRNTDALLLAKAETDEKRAHGLGTKQSEDPVKDCLSPNNIHFNKNSESVQPLSCLNRLLDEESDLISNQCSDTQCLIAANAHGSASEPVDTEKNKMLSKEGDNSTMEHSQAIDNKESTKCSVLEDNEKSSEEITGPNCEDNIQPEGIEQNCEKDTASLIKKENETLKTENQGCDSVEACNLEDHHAANNINANLPESSEDASEPKIALNPKQDLEGLKSLRTELISEKAFEAQIPDMIGENIIDEITHCKIAETNGEKLEQAKCDPPTSISKCIDQIKSIADKNNNKNGEHDVQMDRGKSATYQMNGKDADFKVLPNEECLEKEALEEAESNLDSKVNNISKNNLLGKTFPSNESVKPFMNGDIAVEDVDERRNSDNEFSVRSSVDPNCDSRGGVLPQGDTSLSAQDSGRKQCSSERSSPVDDASIAAVHSCNENSISSETECMEIESSCVKKAALSPVISCEESSLSNDFADQNGLQTHRIKNANGENAVKAVVTEVTTTSTISTESKTVYKVSELSAVKENKERVMSSAENCSVSTITTTTTTTVTKLTAPTTDSSTDVISVKEHSKTVVTTTVTDSLTTPSGTLVTSMTVSKEYSTRDKVKLMKFTRPKKTRSGTALPSYRKFVTKSSKKSIFVLPSDDLKKLARKGGIREVPCFNYTAKPALDIWPYPSPRPTFGITWRYSVITMFKKKWKHLSRRRFCCAYVVNIL